VITDQQESIVRLQTDVLDVRSERNALERQLSKVERSARSFESVSELELEAQRRLEPKQVFANLGAALQEADDDLASERYRVDDVDFTLKTNVIQTDEGIRMHLPSLDESSVSANLSEVSFRLRAPRGETEDAGPTYTDVPDLRGQPHEVAARRLAAANLAVGTVERATDGDCTGDRHRAVPRALRRHRARIAGRSCAFRGAGKRAGHTERAGHAERADRGTGSRI